MLYFATPAINWILETAVYALFNQNRLPSCFNNFWLKNQERRTEDERQLRNDEDFFCTYRAHKTYWETACPHPSHSVESTWRVHKKWKQFEVIQKKT